MSTDPQPALKNWIPYKLVQEEGQWLCRWLYAGDHRFLEPFFDETILACKKHAFNSTPFHCVSELADLPLLAQSLPSLVPTAFIFHTSRCGSTLLSQLLGMDEQSISLAEVPLFDELLQLQRSDPSRKEELGKALAAAISLCGQKRMGHEQHLFVKLDSWHVFFYESIRRLYPDVPFVFLYRTPGEVLSSHRRQRGMQAVPGVIDPGVFGFTQEEISGLSLDDYTAQVLERYLLAFSGIAANDHNVLLLNYKEGVVTLLEKLLKHAGLSYGPGMLEKMTARSRYHSKHPDQSFSEEQAAGAQPAALGSAMHAYNRLEKMREGR